MKRLLAVLRAATGASSSISAPCRDPQAASLPELMAPQPGIFLISRCKSHVLAQCHSLAAAVWHRGAARRSYFCHEAQQSALRFPPPGMSPRLRAGRPAAETWPRSGTCSSRCRPRASSPILPRPQAHRPLPASCHTLPDPHTQNRPPPGTEVPGTRQREAAGVEMTKDGRSGVLAPRCPRGFGHHTPGTFLPHPARQLPALSSPAGSFYNFFQQKLIKKHTCKCTNYKI